ncbi:hypothetical protein M422DRAFT_201012 [Sphaerobolus stellatus SS14]|nr:hypothetical protein M422DRAFT_201012 [Sphaerobolus stellatus SS14]
MDIQTLSNLFAATLNPDPNARKAAELEIRRVGRQEGLITALVQIIGNEGVDVPTRQACSIFLKNKVRRYYYLTPGTGDQPIFVSDRQTLRSNLIPMLIATQHRLIKTQLSQTLRHVISEDFPKDWPSVLDDTKRLLGSSEIRQVETGLVVLLEIVRAFRFKQSGDNITPRVIEQTFPTIVNIGIQLLNSPPAPLTLESPEVPYFLHLILKIYKSTLVSSLSTHQQSAESIVPWGQLLFAVVNVRIPAAALPQDEDEREVSEWWRAKKWAYGILARLFHKFGSPSQLPSVMQEYMPFAEHFVSAFAPEIIKTYLQQIDLYTSGQVWLSKKCQYLIFQFLTECVKPKSTWTLLKDHFERLVSTCIFPMTCFNKEKAELWETEPVDFVRESTEEFEDYSSPISSASSFVMMLARNRTKTTFLPILNFINSVLERNAPAHQRYGALSMVSLLSSCMAKHPTVNPVLEGFLTTHVLREFDAPEKYMNYIACQAVGAIGKYTFPWSENSLSQHFNGLIKCLDSTELPVRVASVEALTILISRHESVKAASRPLVGKIVQDVLKLSDETDLDLLNHVMESMVKHYTNELLPVAAELTTRLCQLYQRLVQESVANQTEEDEDIAVEKIDDLAEDKVYSAMGMAKTILTIIQAMESSPDILGQLQEIIAPVVIYTLENIVLDLLSSAYDIIDTLTFNLRRISPSMWPAYEITYKIFKADAVDFLEEMLPSLDNYITFGKDVFAQRPDYRAMAVDIYTTAMTSEHLGDNDRVNGSKVAESLLLNLPGHLDDALPTFISTALKYLSSSGKRRYFHINNLNVLINCMYYNPALTLQILESQGATRQFFEEWFKVINSAEGMPRVHCKKLTTVALCRLLETDPAAIPASLQEAWGTIMAGLLRNLRDLPHALEQRKADFDKHAEDDDDDLDDYSIDELNLEGDPEADVWDADSEYLEYLAKEGARLQQKESTDGYESESDDDDDDEWAEDELGYISPLDALDVNQNFKHSLTVFQMKNPQAYSAATNGLSIDWQAVMMEVMARADQPIKV